MTSTTPTRRNSILHTNNYQHRMLWPTILASLIFCGIITLFILYFQKKLIEVVLYSTQPPDVRMINTWSIHMLLAVWGLFFLFLGWAHAVSCRLLGAFQRILDELDLIIRGRLRRTLKVRPKDELALALLKRINFLLENVQWPNAPEHQVDARKTIGRF